MPVSPSTECPICGSDAEFVREDQVVTIKRQQARVRQEFLRCGACEEEFMTPGQMLAGQERAVRAIREREGLLQSQEIRAFRHASRLGQGELAELLGVRPKMVARWEAGTVQQGRAMDILLRVLGQDRAALADFAEERGIKLSEG